MARERFHPAIQTRGGLLIKKWGRSSAASTAVSIESAIKDLVNPTAEGDWFSTAVLSNGNPYGIQDGLVGRRRSRAAPFADPDASRANSLRAWRSTTGSANAWPRAKKSSREKGLRLATHGHRARNRWRSLCPVDLEDTLLPGEM